MTRNPAFQKAVRRRMAETGEHYTTAMRALQSGASSVGDPSPLADALQPGTLTTIVCGGGLTNLAFAIPDLVRLHRSGHPLLLNTSEREGITELPSLIDVLIGRGVLPVGEVSTRLLADDLGGVPDLVNDHLDHFRYFDERTGTESYLVAELQTAAKMANRPAVFYNQDIQVAGPVSGLVDGLDGVAGQTEALARVAHASGAIVIACHCMEAEYEDGWRVATNAADHAFVIDYDDPIPRDDPTEFVLQHLVDGQPIETVLWQVDHRPFRWRSDLLEAQRRRDFG